MTDPGIRDTPTRKQRRVNPRTGWAFAGSQRNIQAYTNNPALTDALNRAVREAFPHIAAAEIEWRAPLAEHRYEEPRDETLWTAIRRPDLQEAAAEWWPRRGPAWDAVALADGPSDKPSVILIEAKANIPEFTGGGFAGNNENSIRMIHAALGGTLERLDSEASLTAWTGPHYQLANRLAWTLWLRDHDVDAHFGYVLSTTTSSTSPRPNLR